jgi:hypothetical protein
MYDIRIRECIIPLAIVFCLKLVGLFVANKERNAGGLKGLSTPVFPLRSTAADIVRITSRFRKCMPMSMYV